MSIDDSLSVMRRKTGTERPLPEIGAPTAAKILRTALMQAGEEVAALPIIANIPEEKRVTLAPMVEEIAENALVSLLEGPDQSYGLAIVDPQALAALIEVQTTGRVATRPAEPRPPTRTDAIMCADFIDRTLELLEIRASDAEIDLAPVLTGFRYALALPEPRAVSMTLSDIPYRSFSVGLDMGRGAKQGRIEFVFPFDPVGTRNHGTAGVGSHGFTEALAEAVQGAQARLSGTLHRVELPLSRVMELSVGTLVSIPGQALTRVSIEDIEGRPVAQGRLGMQNGQRAIRIGTAQTDGVEAAYPEHALSDQAPTAMSDGAFSIAANDHGGGLPDLAGSSGLDETVEDSSIHGDTFGNPADAGQIGGSGDSSGVDDGKELPNLPDLEDLSSM
ncbi:FliM/FliN family flagellar motor switch protein [Maritimibacter dapengensis]|uniref:FliM/FliN family flagellar motor switch protein n=1 Tax=Maritimibacter dapengensis TaxID=2836868 RepID=A0ABS6SYK6_9RHOB|nr:flagellar motor switch protein FliM [Maritimibacter dapengensis]MBV7378055.1 FliM/FliN family flagellar motor switch protein [Maritimibacter dapengensis]